MQNKLVGKVTVGAKSITRSESASKPEIDVRMSGDQIESIVITCGCGETHTIVCQYPAESYPAE